MILTKLERDKPLSQNSSSLGVKNKNVQCYKYTITRKSIRQIRNLLGASKIEFVVLEKKMVEAITAIPRQRDCFGLL